MSRLKCVVCNLNHLFYMLTIVLVTLTVSIYSDLKYQKEYKQNIEKRTFKFDDYMWCDNCFFFKFDSLLTISFFIVAYCSITLGCIICILAAYLTFKTLKSKSIRLSRRTKSVQRNILYSLMVAVFVHIVLIVIPLAIYFLSNFIRIFVHDLGNWAVLMLQEHGSMSTLAMILTNKVMRKGTVELFSIETCKSTKKTFPTSVQSVQYKRPMLNATCQVDEPTHFHVAHYACALFSVPIYIVAFLVMILKCAGSFKTYRNYLAVHIFLGFVLEIHMGFALKLIIPFPLPIMCSMGIEDEYSIFMFQAFIIILALTGLSTVSLFIFRMNAATQHVEISRLKVVTCNLNYLLYLVAIILSALAVSIYSDLKYQKEYKHNIEMKTFQFSAYIWCDNCFFFKFDSLLTISFFIVAYCSMILGCIICLLAAYLTFETLNSNSIRLSARTKSVQRNIMYSLIVAVFVHMVLIVIPLAIYFVSNFIQIYIQADLQHFEYQGPYG
uniref:Uncharacterized protein n=1 Tax=Caenorhabditis japonica TaxID=281687 RepID=A0A8R1HI21_CAEJA